MQIIVEHGARLPRSAAMIGLPTGARIWIAAGVTDMHIASNMFETLPS